MQTGIGQAIVLDGRHSVAPAARYSLRLPAPNGHALRQDEAFFTLAEDQEEVRIRFHDYAQIYRRPGLYEQLFYGRLKCVSPNRMAEWLATSVEEDGGRMQSLRVLDFGAGNGMMGEAIAQVGVARLVGIDILEEARDATDRDRPGLYDAYFVDDLDAPSPVLREDLAQWRFDCLTSVAALGFGDIPTRAFVNACNLIEEGGWICFNIKETFLNVSDDTGFSMLIRALLQTQQLELHRMIRYRHRFSIDGLPLHYYGIVARKKCRHLAVVDE